MNDANKPAPIRVATIFIDAAFDLAREHESAAQYHEIRVEPGEYPVEVRTSTYGDRYVAAVFTGTCISSGYGNKRYTEEEGKPSTVVRSPYKYQLRSGRYLGRVEMIDAAALDTARGV